MLQERAERVKMMKESYMKLHNEGKGINEIAEIYKLSLTTCYNALQEIADQNCVTRESLLIKPRIKSDEVSQKKEKLNREPVNLDELKIEFGEIECKIVTVISETKKIIQSYEEDE